jgi:mRNA interferase RelE/StbE
MASSYSVRLKPSAEKDLRKLPKAVLPRILEEISSLRNNPFPPGTVKLKNADRLFRSRVGDYRIIYEVEAAARQILVHYIRHRREVYRFT